MFTCGNVGESQKREKSNLSISEEGQICGIMKDKNVTDPQLVVIYTDL